MHKLPIVRHILAIVLRHADRVGANVVTAVQIRVGELSSYVDRSIQLYWEMLATGTPAEGSRLVFSREPAELQCRQCGEHVRYSPELRVCPSCGGAKLDAVSGTKVTVESMEIGPPAGERRQNG